MKKIFAAVAILLAGCASAPDGPDAKEADVPAYSTQEAEAIPVGVIPQALVRDPKGVRDVEVYIEYPTRGGPNPVLLFSHALGASGKTYAFLTSYWASQGYVVMRVRHADSNPAGTAAINDDWETQAPTDWRNRARDLSVVIDSLGTLEEQYPELKGKMDHARIGVAGHSYGAFTAMLAGGVRTFSGTTASSYADPRVKAIVAMSPQGAGERRGLTRESWAELRIPALFLTGTSDRGAGQGEDETWRRQGFEWSPPGEKWFVSLTGASQYTFAGRMTPPPAVVERSLPTIIETDPRTGRPIETPVPQGPATASNASSFLRERQLFNVVRTVTVAFWDTYLKNEAKGREYLTKLSSRGDMKVETK